MSIFSKIKDKLAIRKAKRACSNVEVSPKGVCMAIYCAKIVLGLLKRSEVMTAYESELYTLYLMSNNIQKPEGIWTHEQRLDTAASYLTFATNGANGEEVKNRILQELEEYL